MPMTRKKINRFLLHMVLASLMFLVAWLWWVPMRCMLDGSSFRWGSSFGFATLNGTGLLGDFPILALLSSYIISMVYLGWRGAKLPFHIMLLAWCLVELSTSIVSAVQHPEAYRFRGDTFGIDISLAMVGPTIWGVLLAVSLAWVSFDLLGGRTTTTPRWTKTNTFFLVFVIALLPIQFLLFRQGEQHGLTDKIALTLTIIQWILLNLSFMPWGKRERAESESVLQSESSKNIELAVDGGK